MKNTGLFNAEGQEPQKQALNIPVVMWRCSRQFRMKDTKEVCFKNGGLYEQVKEHPLTLKDEDGIAHELAPHWVKWFHNATQRKIIKAVTIWRKN